ncbi:MAG: hypothetical protein IT214_03175 [Chitinophagaceae bacterium]|jgi:hypothetical protein|nr:hypothetical protein [Chitinophagaceae bacterium]OQY96978.1 MAG: hypothetical protein B6D37_00325 [Sphingobacteriales bacterium UTBCD1]
MSNIFSPYKIFEYIPGNSVELELPAWRKSFYFIFFRIFPVILILLVTSVFLLEQKGMPFLLVVASLVSVLSIILFLKKYPVKIIISRMGVELHRKTVSGEEMVSISTSEIGEIQCRVRHGKGGGAFFYIKTVNKTKVNFLTIPILNMKNDNINAIKEELKNILGFDCRMI